MITFFNALLSVADPDPTETSNNQDLCAQLAWHGVFILPAYHGPHAEVLTKSGRFSEWTFIPPLIRVVLVVPRDRLRFIRETLNPLKTPALQCMVAGVMSRNYFSSVHVAFGVVVPTGTLSNPSIRFIEDAKGMLGTQCLVASFIMPARLLTDRDPQNHLHIHLVLRPTVASIDKFARKLGTDLSLFSAPLTDTEHVHILPEHTITPDIQDKPKSIINPRVSINTIGTIGPLVVSFDESSAAVKSLTVKLNVETADSKRLFAVERLFPVITQVSPCVIKVILGTLQQDVAFPYPIVFTEKTVRLARASSYIEVSPMAVLLVLMFWMNDSLDRDVHIWPRKGCWYQNYSVPCHQVRFITWPRNPNAMEYTSRQF